ncbi:hypothetical protein M9H77_29768 [Catharanthus roseus]|uniref:Uncharacterized protein n=1 Tax=Catharanthus roseus TaxID=4058 RepID=A0ACB9ZW95_CATRO|nr:hypothetical protein M9H77_29768 [Catharanthus roseus]
MTRIKPLKKRKSPLPQVPLPKTTEVEKSKKDECLPENKNEFEEGELEKENKNLVKSQEDHREERQETKIEIIEKNEEVNFLNNETNSFLVENSLCVQAVWKQTTENMVERRHLIKNISGCKNFYFYVGMASNCVYRFVLAELLPTFFKKGLLSMKNEVPSKSRKDEKETKTDENRVKMEKIEAAGEAGAPNTDGSATYHHQ